MWDARQAAPALPQRADGSLSGEESGMLMNRLETILVNSPIRALIQRDFEVPRLLRLGGTMKGGKALELGCGRGVGAELILDRFQADSVDAIDLDPKMVAMAKRRLARHGDRARVEVGDAEHLTLSEASYDAVFAFGVLEHMVDWRKVLLEVFRVLKPGGRFYGGEALVAVIHHPVWRHLFYHPQGDRFDGEILRLGLETAGFHVLGFSTLGRHFAWYAARKPTAS